MRKFDLEQTMIALELQQMLVDFGREVDFNGGRDIGDFYTEDGTFVAGDHTYAGRAAVQKFYADRNRRVLTEQKDSARTSRHTFCNVQIAIQDQSHATINFFNVNYSSEGHAPLFNLVGPTMFSDCRMDCRRDGEGHWRIAWFGGEPIFIGNDQFMNRLVVKEATRQALSPSTIGQALASD